MTATDSTTVRADAVDPAADGAGPIDRVTAMIGLGGVLAAALLCGWLDLVTGEDMHGSTISGYVYSHPITFTTAVIALVMGSCAVLCGLVRGRMTSMRHPGAWLMVLWIAGMIVVAVFPKHDWSVGPSLSGHLHRVGSLVAFLALPLAVVLLTRGALRRGMGRWARAALALAIASYAYLGYLAFMIYAAGQDGVRWWRAVPLGLSERVLLVLEVGALAMLALGLLRRARPTPR
jgi:hypothetical protein